jgi:hypothetical protein
VVTPLSACRTIQCVVIHLFNSDRSQFNNSAEGYLQKLKQVIQNKRQRQSAKTDPQKVL